MQKNFISTQREFPLISLSHLHHCYYLILNYIHIAALRDAFLSLLFITPFASIWLTPDALHLRMLFISISYHPTNIMSFQEKWYFLYISIPCLTWLQFTRHMWKWYSFWHCSIPWKLRPVITFNSLVPFNQISWPFDQINWFSSYNLTLGIFLSVIMPPFY